MIHGTGVDYIGELTQTGQFAMDAGLVYSVSPFLAGISHSNSTRKLSKAFDHSRKAGKDPHPCVCLFKRDTTTTTSKGLHPALPCVGNGEQNSLDDVLLVISDTFQERRNVVVVKRKSLHGQVPGHVGHQKSSSVENWALPRWFKLATVRIIKATMYTVSLSFRIGRGVIYLKIIPNRLIATVLRNSQEREAKAWHEKDANACHLSSTGFA